LVYDAAMVVRPTLAFTTLGWLAALGVAAFSCEANVESRCVGGNGNCTETEFTDPSTSTTGTGGGGGGGCFSNCDPTVGLGLTGEFPCEIEVIMDNCRRCHTTPAASGAPFPLDTYAEAQVDYFDEFIWQRLGDAVATDFMPLQPPKLTDPEKGALDAWICECAPPREAGVTCN
jgi:hypothetical protein